MRTRLMLVSLFALTIPGTPLLVAEEAADAVVPMETSSAEPAMAETPVPEKTPAPATKASRRRVEKADAFVAPADWEFDGFVAGGQDQDVRSMFYLGDLVYLNIGTDHGFTPGDRVSIYKRGDRIRDPQTGRFLGYEVRRAAMSQVTDKADPNNCSVRILQANEAVEIGDLVRRDE